MGVGFAPGRIGFRAVRTNLRLVLAFGGQISDGGRVDVVEVVEEVLEVGVPGGPGGPDEPVEDALG